MSDELNHEECSIGLSADGEVLICTLPLKKYVDNDVDGAALVYGKFRELQAHAMQMFNQMKVKKMQAGLVRVNGKLPIDIKVN